MQTPESEYVVNFPTLWIAPEWVEAHCVIPDGWRRGDPFVLQGWQLWNVVNHYRVRPGAGRGQLATAFHYRRSQTVRPQKAGKGPVTAATVCLEGVGPAVFAGWAAGGEVYDCRDHGCGCGWMYEYEPGEPMGTPWPTPLIQITAFSEEQTGNVYDALRPMIEYGPLAEVIPKTGEEFIRLPGGGRIDTVTSSAQSRLGQRVTFCPQDEALALDTPLPTPSGWTTMGDVVVGDVLLGADGRPVRVLKATEVQHGRQCFRVTFSDGSSVVASDGHLWRTKVVNSAAKPRVRSTGEMVADGRGFRVPAPGAFDLPDADFPFDPYALGLWLGDGATGKQEITAHVEEVDELRGHLAAVGIDAYVRLNGGVRAPTLCLSRKAGFQGSGRPEWAKALQALPCYRNKHIPPVYLRGSRVQREALLQGLMDSDGHITETGHCTFAGNAGLAADVASLLRTFGIHTRPVRHADARARTGEGWKVNFLPRLGLQPFRLARKQARVRQTTWLGMDWVTIVNIQAVDSVPVRCVGVDAEDHLFLAGEGCHVTHNTGIWTETNKMIRVAETQRRGLAGMGGRSWEYTNGWDPSENSVAQRTADSRRPDIFRDHPQAPSHLSYTNKQERRRIHRYVYAGSPWVDLDGIEAEAAELLEKDPGQAERFFGNRIVSGKGTYLERAKWDARIAVRTVEAKTQIVLGFDGSDVDDWTGFRAETLDGFQFTPTFGPASQPTVWNPADYGGQVPRLEVEAALDELMARYDVVRLYADPPEWETEVDTWSARYGEKRVVRWYTRRVMQMHEAAERLVTDVTKVEGGFAHDGCEITGAHVANTRKAARPGSRYVLAKASQPQKIDLTVCSVLAHEAAGDAIAAGLARPKKSSRMIVMR